MPIIMSKRHNVDEITEERGKKNPPSERVIEVNRVHGMSAVHDPHFQLRRALTAQILSTPSSSTERLQEPPTICNLEGLERRRQSILFADAIMIRFPHQAVSSVIHGSCDIPVRQTGRVPEAGRGGRKNQCGAPSSTAVEFNLRVTVEIEDPSASFPLFATSRVVNKSPRRRGKRAGAKPATRFPSQISYNTYRPAVPINGDGTCTISVPRRDGEINKRERNAF